MRKLILALTAVSLFALNGCDKIDKLINPSLQTQTTFSTTPPAIGTASTGGVCALDTINGVITKEATVAKANPLIIAGWAVDNIKGSIPEQVIARLTSSNSSQAFYAVTSDRVSRPDVAAHMKDPALEKSGFNLTATLETVPLGQYTLELLQPTATSLLLCADKGQIVIQ